MNGMKTSAKILVGIIFLLVLVPFTLISTVFAIDTSQLNQQKIDSELLSKLKELSQDDQISLILISNVSLKPEEVLILKFLNAEIVNNYTLANWYEINIPAGNITNLEKLYFVNELKAIKTEYALDNKSQSDYVQTTETKRMLFNPYILIILVLVVIFIIYYLFKIKSDKSMFKK